MKTFFYLNNKIMKTNKFISFRNLCCIVLCAVLCTACPPDTCKNAKLRIEENSLEFLGAGGSASVDVASNVELKVSCEETWCSVSPKTAIGNVTLNVTVQRNSTAMPRVAKITVQSVDCGISKEIVVIQKEGQPVGPDCDLNGNCLNVTPVDLNFEQSGSSNTVAVTSNVSWTAMSDQQWCTVSPANSSNNGTVNITVAENTGVGSRISIVTIRDNEHSLSKDITVTQAGNEPAIAVSPETKEVGSAASSFEVNVTANVTWQVASDQSWCTVSPATGNGNGKVTVSIAAYTGAASRMAKLTISNSTYQLSKTVTVTQTKQAEVNFANFPGVWQAVKVEQTNGNDIIYNENLGILFTVKDNGTFAWEILDTNPDVLKLVSTGLYITSAEAKTIALNGTMYAGGEVLMQMTPLTYLVSELTNESLVITSQTSNDKFTFRRKDKIRTAHVSTVSISGVTISNISKVLSDVSGNLYISLIWHGNSIYKVTPSGSASVYFSADIINPRHLYMDGVGNIYVTEFYHPANQSYRVRRISPSGTVSNVLIGGLNTLFGGVAANHSGDIVYVSQTDYNTYRILRVSGGTYTVLAGGATAGMVDGIGTAARFGYPRGMALDAAGNLYVADQSNHAIRKVTPSGRVTTLAGNGTAGNVDGVGRVARFNQPLDVAVDSEGNVYVAEFGGHRIRKISPAGWVNTVAGRGTAGNVNDTGVSAAFNQPCGLWVDASGNVIHVADNGNSSVRRIDME